MKSIFKNIIISTAVNENERADTIDALRCRDAVGEALKKTGYEVTAVGVTAADLDGGLDDLVASASGNKHVCVFNLFEGFSDDPYAEVRFVRRLEETGISFTGNGSAALDICLDKGRVNGLLRENGINVPEGMVLKNTAGLKDFGLGFPVFVKPVCEDASVGIDGRSLIKSRDALYALVNEKLGYFPNGLIVEEFIPGVEFNVSFIGKGEYELIGVSRMDYGVTSGKYLFLDFASKWDRTSEEYLKLLPEVLRPEDTVWRDRSAAVASEAADLIGCEGYFRVDLREKNGELFVLDVNPNPDINTDSGFMRQAYAKRLTYEDVINNILVAAEMRD